MQFVLKVYGHNDESISELNSYLEKGYRVVHQLNDRGEEYMLLLLELSSTRLI